MNRVGKVLLGMMAAMLIFGVATERTLAQDKPAAPAQGDAQKTPDNKDAKEKQGGDGEGGGGNPFAPEPSPTLPPGMTGSDVNDPRAKLSPGMYDAGEAAMGLKHLDLVKKPEAFDIGSSDADSPKVQNTLVQLGVPDDRLKTISFGKERPVCTEQDEACYQKNRRGHLAPAQ